MNIISKIVNTIDNGAVSFVQSKFIKSVDCDILLILGERSNGKSFAVKETVIKDAYYNDIQFAYIRRYADDIKDYLINEYFEDVILNKNGHQYIKEWTNGEYSTITAYQKSIYFANYDEEKGRVIKGKKIGRMFGLSSAEHYKSLAFPGIKNLIYEEFITDGYYLGGNEPKKLLNLMSTILRHEKGKLYCIGNKVSRICPYFGEWGLVKVPKQKIGTVDIYNLKDEDTTTRIGVYMTHTMKFNSGMFFGNANKAISKGEWETEEQPHIKGHRDDYKCIYSVVMKYDKSAFLCEFLQGIDSPDLFTWYVSPKTTPIQNNTRVVANSYNINPLCTIGFIPLNQNENIIFNMLKQGKVCYSDNLTGTEFKQCFKMIKTV